MQELINLLFKLNENQLKEVEAFINGLLNPKKKRSLSQNAYAWELINKIANSVRKSKEEVYMQMLKDYGQSEIVSILSEVNPEGFFKYYEAIGTGIVNNKEFTHYRIYKGSSEYNTLEMSIFIDGIVQEAENLEIPTLTAEQIKNLRLN